MKEKSGKKLVPQTDEKKLVKTYRFEALGFPVILHNVLMKKMMGEWVLDIDLNELQRFIMDMLCRKQAPLTGAEVRFIRKYFEMTKAAFAKIAGVTHAAVAKWENHNTKNAQISLSTETCIRLFALEKLYPDSKDFVRLYKLVVLRHFADENHSKIQPLTVDVQEEFAIAC